MSPTWKEWTRARSLSPCTVSEDCPIIRTTWYNLHGVSIKITAPPDIEEAIAQRLSSFQSNACSTPALDFRFTVITGLHIAPAIDAGRSVYEVEGGEVLYHSETDTLTARYRDIARMTCDVQSGLVQYQLTGGEEASRAASHLLFTLPLIELLRARGLYNIHAAGLCKGTSAMLLAGPSGAGKSTLTLAMTRAGWGYLGDDMLFLTPERSGVLGFPEGIDYFAEMPVAQEKAHIRPEMAFGTAALLHATPRVLIFPQVAHTAVSTLTKMVPTEAFLELVPNVLMTGRGRCERHLAALESLTRGTPAFRLRTGTDLHEAEQVIHNQFDLLAP